MKLNPELDRDSSVVDVIKYKQKRTASDSTSLFQLRFRSRWDRARTKKGELQIKAFTGVLNILNEV